MTPADRDLVLRFLESAQRHLKVAQSGNIPGARSAHIAIAAGEIEAAARVVREGPMPEELLREPAIGSDASRGPLGLD